MRLFTSIILRHISALLFVLVPLVAHAEKPLTLEFWHSMTGAKGRLLTRIVDDFNKRGGSQESPKQLVSGRLQVRLQFIGSYEEGLNKLRTALIAKRAPHVIQVTDIGAKVMIDSDSTIALQDFIDKDPSFAIDQILLPIRNYYSYRGRLQALPFATSNPILYYNKDLLRQAGIEKPPATFAELEEVAKKLTKDSTIGITWPINSWFFEEFLARQGAVFVDGGNGRDSRPLHANYLSPEGIAFAELWKRLHVAGSYANYGRGWDSPQQNFLAGRVAMLITSTSDIFENFKQAPFNLGTAPIPTQDLDKPGGTVVGGNALWIVRDKPASERQAVYEFIKYMASPEVQQIWHTNTGYFPIRNDVIEKLKAEGFYQKFPVAWTAIEQLRSAADMPATKGALLSVFPEAREHVAIAIEELLSGRYTVVEALERAKKKTDFSLARSQRWGD